MVEFWPWGYHPNRSVHPGSVLGEGDQVYIIHVCGRAPDYVFRVPFISINLSVQGTPGPI